MRIRYSILLTLTVFLFSNLTFAQTQNGRISGTVVDVSGLVIPNAKVTVTNAATGVSKSFISDSQGRFAFTDLQPGEYSMSAELASFKRFVRTGVVVRVAISLEIPITLEVGSISEEVTVSAEAPLLSTSSSSLGEVVEGDQILQLPLNGLQALSLVYLVPGVTPNRQTESTSQNFNRIGNFSVGGSRGNTSEAHLDGVPNTVPEGGTGAMSALAVLPSLDSIMEFKVQTNTFSAEYGRTGGGIVNVATKSGSNALHGSVFEFLRNSVLDANNFFNNRNGIRLASFKRNQFGGSLGGPVTIPGIHKGTNRTFFFVSYEGLRERSSTPRTGTVPTSLERNGDFSQTYNSQGKQVIIYDPLTTSYDPATGTYVRQPFKGNIIPPERFDPIMKKVLSFWPEPTGLGAANTHANNYAKDLTTRINDNKFDARIDHQISSKQSLFFHFSYGDRQYDDDPFYGGVASTAGSLPSWYRSIALGDTYAFSPRLVMEIKYAYNYLGFAQDWTSKNYNLTELGFPKYLYDASQMHYFPVIYVDGYGSRGQAFGPADAVMWGRQEGHNGMINFTWITGGHVLKTGADIRLGRTNRVMNFQSSGSFTFSRSFTQGPNALAASTAAGNSMASAILGYASTGLLAYAANPAVQSWYQSFYLQDDWKLNKKLTLNLGIRYDLEWPLTERFNHISWFDPALDSPIASQVPSLPLRGAITYATPSRRSPFKVDKNNFAPRVGIAYRVMDSTVISAAYGIFYTTAGYGVGAHTGMGWSTSTPYVGSTDGVTPSGKLTDPFPNGFVVPDGITGSPAISLGQSVYDFDRQAKQPYVQQWNLNIQRGLGTSMVIDLSYVGNKGTHLEDKGFALTQLRADQLSPDINALVNNPFYGIIKIGSLAAAKVPQRLLMTAYPQYSAVSLDRPGAASSIYHSFQARVTKRFSKGANFLVSYTNGKLIDDNAGASAWLSPSIGHQNYYNRRADRAISDEDISQRFVASFSFSMPFGRKGTWGRNWSTFLEAILGGWQANGIVTLQSGIPLSLTTTNTSYSGSSTLRPNNNGKSARLEGSATERLNKWFDTSVFSAPPLYTFGNVGRNLPDVRGPGQRNLDFSLSKSFVFGEGRYVQFRSEAFNLTNTPEFNNPDTNLQSADFGRILSQRNRPRQIQFGLRIAF